MRPAIALFLGLAACGPDTGNDTPDGGTTGDGSTADTTCGGQALELTYIPPSFLVVLDRSCSMPNNMVPGTMPAQNRWQVAVAALSQAITAHADDIDWGLSLFPDTGGQACRQGAITQPVGPSNAMPIVDLLTAALDPADPLYPDDPCVTNIDTAMTQVSDDPSMIAAGTQRYVMLVTDGAQSGNINNPAGPNNCRGNAADPDTEAAIAALKAQGVTTFVVGFGGNVDATALDAFAIAGGAPNTGAKKFYAAESPQDLAQTFAAISAAAVSCSYTVSQTPPDLAQTWVVFGGSEIVPRDPTHVDGWDYDPATMTLTFYGAQCGRLQDRSVTDVDVVFGCPTPPIL